MADITSRLRVLAKNIIVPASALLLVVGLAGCGSTSGAPAPATSDSSSSASNDGSASDSSPAPSQPATPADIDSASTADQVNAFAQAFKDAGFTSVDSDTSGTNIGVSAYFGPNNQYRIDIGPSPEGGGIWSLFTGGGNDGVSPETISQVENAWLPQEYRGSMSISGAPTSEVLKIINHIQLENGVIQQR